MANLPASIIESAITPYEEVALRLFLKGWRSRDVARKLAPGANAEAIRRRRQIMWRFHIAISRNEALQMLIAEASRGALIEGTEEVAEALVRRARSGRPDAAKLVLEMSGFYNPKQRVEHSGEIRITLEGLTRPQAVEDVTDAQEVD